jgi:hypothetical protein
MRALNALLFLLLAGTFGLALYVDSSAAWRHASAGAPPSATPVQITTPSGVVDRCPTCHRSALAGRSQASQAGKSHPRLVGHDGDLARTGCSTCHGGQGRRLDRAAHRPALGGGSDPFLRQPLLQARCARCHVPGDLQGAPVLAAGFREYLDAACSGCHQPGRVDPGLGPDLRRLGRRTEAELRRALLDPRQMHPSAVMWSLRWRFVTATPAGRDTLSALLTALLAISDSPAPYRSAWANPTLRVDVDCTSCHSFLGDRATGPAHRCTYVIGNESLRCGRCHGTATTRPPTGHRPHRECPQVRAARPTCTVCHLRPGDGSGSRTGER